MSFNTAFINYISQYGIPLHFFNYYNFYRDILECKGDFHGKKGIQLHELIETFWNVKEKIYSFNGRDITN